MQTRPEYELKFELDPQQVTRLLRAAWLQEMIAEAPVKRRLRAVYYDTPDWDLRDQNVSFRIRKSGHKYFQCVKSTPRESHKAVARDEFEIQVPDSSPHPEMIPNEQLPFKRKLCERLQPVFETDIQRTIRILHPDGQTELELAVDKGDVRCEDSRDSLCEVEVELRKGTPAALYDAGRQMIRSAPARLAVRYKADRGYQLASTVDKPWLKAEAPTLSEEMTAEEALSKLFLTCLRQVRLSEEYAFGTNNAEAVHQLRVGLCRLRAVLQIYKKALPSRDYKRFNNGFKWLTDRAGSVRDWDVFMDRQLRPLQARFPDAACLNTLLRHAESMRAHAQASLSRALRSTRYGLLLLDASEWIHERRWREQPVNESSAALFSPARQFADARLKEHYEKALEKGKHVDSLSAQEQHRLRIAIKKLRYGCELFSSLYKKKAAKPLIKRLKDLQNTLGKLNDIANLPRLSDALENNKGHSGETDTDLAYAAGLLTGWQSCESACLQKQASKQWKKMQKTSPAWE